MESGYLSLGMGLLIAIIVLAFTFLTALITAGLQSYNLAISISFVMGGLLCICLSAVFRSCPFSKKENCNDSQADR
ncbi:hypothetical protein [Methanolacinia petrolearia]|uniref:hypothetical protein n=1 Tax=Methanolacinia petrolearia TaxID=54120 RepID=UPI003BAD0314